MTWLCISYFIKPYSRDVRALDDNQIPFCNALVSPDRYLQFLVSNSQARASQKGKQDTKKRILHPMTEFESKYDMVEYIFIHKNLYKRDVRALDDNKIPFCHDIVSPDRYLKLFGIKQSSQSTLVGHKRYQEVCFTSYDRSEKQI